MKRILLVSIVAAALGLTTSALAQTAGPVGGAPKTPSTAAKAPRVGRKEMEKINEETLAKLNLTEDQKTKIKAHQDEMVSKEAELKAAAKADRKAGKAGDAKEQIKALRKANQAFYKETLTKQQLKEMVRLRREAVKEYEAKNGTTPALTKP